MKLISITLDGNVSSVNVPINTIAYAVAQKDDRAFMLMRLLTDKDVNANEAFASVQAVHPEFQWIRAIHQYEKDPIVRTSATEGGIHYFELRRMNGNWYAMYTQANEDFIRSQSQQDINVAPPDTYMPADERMRAVKELLTR